MCGHCIGNRIKIPNLHQHQHQHQYEPHPNSTQTITFTYSTEEPTTVPHRPEAWNHFSPCSTRPQLITHALQRGVPPKQAYILADRWFHALAPIHYATLRDLTPEEKAQEPVPEESFWEARETKMRKAAANKEAKESLKRVFPDNYDFELGYRGLLEKGWDPKEAEAFVIENYL